MRLLVIANVVIIAAFEVRADEAIPVVSVVDDPRVIAAMNLAWRLTANGTKDIEAAFRLDGNGQGYDVVSVPMTYERMKQRIPIIPGTTFALFHVHPAKSPPRPSDQDKMVSHKYKLKIVTMHREGLYEYDPETQMTIKIRGGLDWLKHRPNPRQVQVSRLESQRSSASEPVPAWR